MVRNGLKETYCAASGLESFHILATFVKAVCEDMSRVVRFNVRRRRLNGLGVWFRLS